MPEDTKNHAPGQAHRGGPPKCGRWGWADHATLDIVSELPGPAGTRPS